MKFNEVFYAVYVPFKKKYISMMPTENDYLDDFDFAAIMFENESAKELANEFLNDEEYVIKKVRRLTTYEIIEDE